MADPETIANQELLLAEHRRRLVVLLEQRARLGDYAPPHIRLDIEDVQRSIDEIKAQLRAWGVAVADCPEDTAVVVRPAVGDPLEMAQALLDQMPLDTIPDVAPLPTGSRMPLARNPLFVGREADLKRLAATLKGGGTAAIGQIAAATGLGGIGKTNLASEFTHRYGQFFAGGVFWLSFADPTGVSTEVAACGVGLNLPGYADLKLDEQVARVVQEWQQSIPRLLVFDNCEDEGLLAQWQPSSGGCRVLVTSRRAEWDLTLGVVALPLDVLPRAESTALLCQFRPDLAEDDPDLAAIAAELGDLPLALHLAGSFLARYRAVVTPAIYLRQLREAPILTHASLEGRGTERLPTKHERHVGRTFALSYERLDQGNPTDALAIGLLARAACFAHGEPIPSDLLRATVEAADDETMLLVEDALVRLVELGLLEVEADESLTLHRLLAAFVQVLPSDATAQVAVEQVLVRRARALNNAGYPTAFQPLQQHLRTVTEVARSRGDERAARLCNELGYYLYSMRDLVSAQPYLEQALVIREVVLGTRHPDTATSLNLLGLLLRTQGDLAGAQGYYKQALATRLVVLGDEHPDTAQSLNNVGRVLQEQGDLAGARPYLEQALAIRRAVLGEQHPHTALSLNNLGGLLQGLGELEEARVHYEQALAIWREVLGEDHPDTAFALNNLGELLHSLGELAGAQQYYEQALAIRRVVLGEKHPNTGKCLNNLGELLKGLGDLAGARRYLEEALAINREVLGERHLDTATSLNNLGALFHLWGELEKAQGYYEQALAIQREMLGERHLYTGLSLNNLGRLLWDLGDFVGARQYYEQALAILEQVLGANHPHLQTVRNNLATLDEA